MTLPTDKEKREHVYESGKSLTWAELKAHIETMDNEQLQQNVTIHNGYTDEYEPVLALEYVSEDGNGILDPFHPFLTIDG